MIEIPPEALKEINDIIQNLIWEEKTAKIDQNTLIKNIDEGGLMLCYYPTKVDALKLRLKDYVVIEKPTGKPYQYTFIIVTI